MFSRLKTFCIYSQNKLNIQSIVKCSSKVIHNTAAKQQATAQNILQETFGQPTSQTHPHLVREGEVVPGIKKDEFKHRRLKFMEKIAMYGAQPENHPQLVIIPSASKVYMSDKIPYVFRQNSDFLYFTGCQDPDSILLLTIHGGNHTSTLFMRPKDAHAELWDGPRTSLDDALSMFGIDEAIPVSEFEKYMTSFLTENKKSIIWYDGEDVIQSDLHKKLELLMTLCQRKVFTCPKTLIHETRIIKSEAEIKLMKKTCEIGSSAIATVIEQSKPGMSEHQLFATVDYECRMKGAEFLAYPPVVAAGKNANIIHYVANNQILRNNEMVLMDAGCEYHGYTSDVTRTWPINGRFTPYQTVLYEIVLEVQKILIDGLKEMPSLDMVYHAMCNLLGKRLQEECLIPKDFTGNKLLAAAYSFCPHHVGHYLGMDVHDTPKISRSIRVQPGMIVTVEPGIYVNPRNQHAPPEFHNCGIRIEDDVLIENTGPVVLSKYCPKEIDDVQALARMNQS